MGVPGKAPPRLLQSSVFDPGIIFTIDWSFLNQKTHVHMGPELCNELLDCVERIKSWNNSIKACQQYCSLDRMVSIVDWCYEFKALHSGEPMYQTLECKNYANLNYLSVEKPTIKTVYYRCVHNIPIIIPPLELALFKLHLLIQSNPVICLPVLYYITRKTMFLVSLISQFSKVALLYLPNLGRIIKACLALLMWYIQCIFYFWYCIFKLGMLIIAMLLNFISFIFIIQVNFITFFSRLIKSLNFKMRNKAKHLDNRTDKNTDKESKEINKKVKALKRRFFYKWYFIVTRKYIHRWFIYSGMYISLFNLVGTNFQHIDLSIRNANGWVDTIVANDRSITRITGERERLFRLFYTGRGFSRYLYNLPVMLGWDGLREQYRIARLGLIFAHANLLELFDDMTDFFDRALTGQHINHYYMIQVRDQILRRLSARIPDVEVIIGIEALNFIWLLFQNMF